MALNARWIILALFVAELPIFVLSHAIFGAGSVTTAVISGGLLGPLLVAGPLTRLDAADIAFIAFVAAILASLEHNGIAAPSKEYVLLALTLCSYVAGRVFPETQPSRGFISVLAFLVIIGTAATAVAVVEQYNVPHIVKPLIFGEFDGAPAQFLSLVGFILIALIAAPPDMPKERRQIFFALCGVAMIVFAAAQVRFTFVAIALVVVLATMQRSLARAAARLGCIVAAVALGLAIRAPVSMIATTHLSFPSECVSDSSIAIRKQLLSEAISMLPDVGAFGIGLDGFMAKSCTGTWVHNSVLQAFLEFGFVGGAALVAMIALALRRVPAPFALYGLIFELMLSLAHGRLSRDVLLFFFIGLAVPKVRA